MKTLYTTIILLITGTCLTHATNYTWTGTTSTAWNTVTNWNPNGLPDSLDNITIGTATNSPVLSQNRKVNNLTMNSDSLNLNTYELIVKGSTTSNLNGGYIYNGTLKFTGRTVNFLGTNFNCYIDADIGQFALSGGQFDLPVMLRDTGFYNSTGEGGCIFNDSLTIVHDGDNWLKMVNTNGDSYNGPVSIVNHSINPVYLSISDTSYFNDNLEIASTNFGGFIFGNSNGVSYLASGKTITLI